MLRRAQLRWHGPGKAAVAIGALAPTTMHTLQAALGHPWFAEHGVVVSSTLLLLMLLPVWAYGELRAQDGLGLDSVREHGTPTLLTASAALYIWAVVSGALMLLDLWRDRH